VTAFCVRLTDQRVLYLGINDTGAKRDFGPVSTDAAAFVVVGTGEEKDRTVTYAYAVGAHTLAAFGRTCEATPRATSIRRSEEWKNGRMEEWKNGRDVDPLFASAHSPPGPRAGGA